MITRSYGDPATTGVVRGGDIAVTGYAPVDYSGMGYTARGLESGVAATFLDITGRAATAEELKKYTDMAVANNDSTYTVVDSIYKDNWDSLDVSKQQINDETGMEGWKREADNYRNRDRPFTSLDEMTSGKWTGNYSGRQFRTEDVANFLTKMDEAQTAKLFTDVGIKGADSLAKQVASKSDYKDDGERVSHVNSLGLDDDKLKIIGKAMFTGGSQFNDPTRPGSQHADNNNADYKTNTAYDPAKGLTFTGGFIPDPKKVDWMGQIVKSVILGGIGFVAAPLAANAAASVLGSAGTTVGYAGAMVPSTLANTVGGVVSGAATGALGAGVSGGDVGKGALTGGLIGGLSPVVGKLNLTGNAVVDKAVGGAIKGGIVSKVSGGDIVTGVISGGVTGALTPTIKNEFARTIVNGAVSSAIKGSRSKA